jgi:hypothetical protein
VTGGDGAAPEPLRQAIAAHLSPLFSQAVLLDAGATPERAADMTTSAFPATVRCLLS